MDIPLPPTADTSKPPPEYSPSQVTSPHSDDDDYMNKMSKDSSPLHSNSSKKVLSKKKVSSMLKSMKMTTTITNLGKTKSKTSLSSESLSKDYDYEENSVSTQDEEDLSSSRSSFTRLFMSYYGCGI